MILRMTLLISLLIFFNHTILAQDSLTESLKARNEFSIWGGASPDSTKLIGVTQDARFGIVALRYARIFKPSRQISLKYTVDAIPAAVLSYPTFRFTSLGNGVFGINKERVARYGWGIAPLGLQINFRRQKKVQPFIASSGGFIYFSKPVPSDFGARFNFTADLGGGVQIMLRDKKALTVGYKYHHLSNGYRAEDNSGFDSNLFYVGFSVFK